MKKSQTNKKKSELPKNGHKNVDKIVVPGENTQSLNVIRRKLIIATLIIAITGNIVSFIIFLKTGQSGYYVTVFFYMMIFFALLLIPLKHKVVKFNLFVFFFLLFCAESFLRISKKGFLDYMEMNSTSIFGCYLSKYHEYSGVRDGIYWLHAPNSSYTDKKPEYVQDYKCNEIGLRERPISEFKSNNFNILMLGDSFTEGVGCPQEQNTPSVMESALKSYYGKNGIKVINGGISGSDLFFSYKLMERLYTDVKPKIVVLNLNTSDIDDVFCRGGDDRFRENKVRYVNNSPWWEYLYSFSYLFRTVANTMFHTNPVSYNRSMTKDDECLKMIYFKILQYNQFCEKRDIKFVLVLSPILKELANNYYSYDKLDQVIKSNTSIQSINLKDIFLQRGYITSSNYNEFYYLQDFHFKPKGYQLVGNIISNEISAYCK
ncbi:MAG: GDSL-type esterase/lipase family protein [Chitinophagales bacterium]